MNLPFNREGWEYILEKYNGYLPVEIETVDEGTILPTGHVTVQIINTDPKLYWLTSYLETALLRSVWYHNTVATTSWHAKQIIQSYMEETCDDLRGLPFKLNDFGARGVSSNESAALGGMSHLVNFAGSDTIMGIVAAKLFYDYKPEKQGVPAAEHSTITSWGKDREVDAYRNMIKKFSGKGKIVAVVSDSYDLYNALENIWGEELKDEVVNNGGLVVIRPDSGDPVEVVCKSLDILADKFGYSLNSKGYKVLPPYIRLIQGDGISVTSIGDILAAMKEKGYSADNIVFGMGGELLQKLDRDIQKYAMKQSAIRMQKLEDEFNAFLDSRNQESEDKLIGSSAFDIKGDWRDVFKDPKTDPGKRSKKGILALTFDEKVGYVTCRRSELNGRENLLKTVFKNQHLLRDMTFNEVRENTNKSKAKLKNLGLALAS
jgi:nicotinamide phosphoribosyltransferase